MELNKKIDFAFKLERGLIKEGRKGQLWNTKKAETIASASIY